MRFRMLRPQQAAVLALCLLALLSSGRLTAADWTWEKTYEHATGRMDAAVAATMYDGRLFVLATCEGSDGYDDVVVLRYEQESSTEPSLWVYSIDNTDVEAVDFEVYGAAIYVAAAANTDFYTIKFPTAQPGGPSWANRLELSGTQRPVALTVNGLEGPVVTGYTTEGEQGRDYLTR